MNTETTSQKCQLGYNVTGLDLNNLSDDGLEQIRQTLWTHGVICIKNQSLTADQQIEFTKRFGNLLVLPPFFAFHNRDPSYPSIVRVGNVQLDDTIKTGCKDAEYWHKDGNFWQLRENFILSILHPKEIAQVGGQTGYVDCEQVWNDLPQELKDELEGASIVIQTKNISDFKSAKPEEHYPDAIHPVFELHPISKVNIFNLVAAPERNVILKDGTVVESSKYGPAFEKAYKIYSHQWEMGDVLIWDNIRVIHRSMGGFGDSRRLLFRTQAQIPF